MPEVRLWADSFRALKLSRNRGIRAGLGRPPAAKKRRGVPLAKGDKAFLPLAKGAVKKCQIPCRELSPQRSPFRQALISNGLAIQRGTERRPFSTKHHFFTASSA